MQEYPAASYIRLTGDNPCVYKPILPELIACLKNENLDYCVSSELPLGGAAEAFTHKSFKAQALGPIGDQEQEHVTAKYYAPGSSFAWRTVPCGFSHLSGLRLTVDEREDLEMMRQLARETGQEPCELSYRKIEDLFEQNPRTFEGNRDVHQRRVSDLESQ